jgi:hypothetical protein
MTTYTDFTPTTQAPFQFQAFLDGASYNVIVTWNFYGQRWYVNVYDPNDSVDPIFTLPRIGSPPAYDISMTAGYFTSTLVFRQGTGQFEVSP